MLPLVQEVWVEGRRLVGEKRCGKQLPYQVGVRRAELADRNQPGATEAVSATLTVGSAIVSRAARIAKVSLSRSG